MNQKFRIFYASPISPNEYIQSDLWRLNLLYALKDLGHEVVEFDYKWGNTFKNLDKADPIQLEFIKKNRPVVSAALLAQITQMHSEAPLDFFFSYFYDACVFPSVIDQIREMGIKTINWYCNGSYQMDLVEEISPHYDYCLVPEEFRLADYRKLGANPIYFQEAANPDVYHPYDLPKEYDVTFVGQNYGNRAEYIRYLYENGVNVRVWGPGWLPKIQETKSLFESGKNLLSRVMLGNRA
jgi:spore maturation protein CgeB